ncbi:DUF4381 domain-containing protein [Pseudomaricurvus sp.]|uniref:DUF4381 domain-containing protein n=1 Tax=Pseudomaricurvus sp. TaxID=2004510 RepID=UPI003F6BB992
MKSNPTGLDQLHDIITAAPAPWWPPAPGWLWLLAIVTILLIGGCIWGIIHYQQNRYRREALAELAQLESNAAHSQYQHSQHQHTTLCGMSTLLKRTAVTAFPRPEVATLTGPAWFAFLDSTGNTRFSEGLGNKLESVIYQITDQPLQASEITALIAEIRIWIRQHQQANDPAKSGTTDTTASKQEAA